MITASHVAELAALKAEIERRKATHALADPLSFARWCGFVPDPWQERVLKWKGKRLLLNCARQAGKSTTTAIRGLHKAVSKAKSLTLLVSPSERQSKELLIKVRDTMAKMPSPATLREDNVLSLGFSNGSRILSLPSSKDTVRGFSAVDLIIEDEAAYVDDSLNIAIRPMLAVSGGEMIMMSSPNGRKGHFFEAWERGGDDYDRECVTAHEIPRYSSGFIEQERADMHRRGLGDLFAQEYECQFVNAAAGRVYGGFDETLCILDALPASYKPWHYVLGLDFGIVDQCAVSILAWRENDPCVYVVKAYRISADVERMTEEVRRLMLSYSFDMIVGDEGGMGKAFAEDMRNRKRIPILPADKANKIGTIALINGDMRAGRVKVIARDCLDLVAEWLELPWAEGGKREADGFNNHAADATLYGWKACPNFHERVVDAEPAYGSVEWSKREHERMMQQDIERMELHQMERRRQQMEEEMFG